jgi:hypothetical protein
MHLFPTPVTFGQIAEVERVIVIGSNIPSAEETGPNPVDTYRIACHHQRPLLVRPVKEEVLTVSHKSCSHRLMAGPARGVLSS